MAYKTKFLHFKTKQSYNTERNKTLEGTDERKVFDAYISFIDEGPTICTWGKEYKCEATLEDIESIINSKGFITINDIPTAPSPSISEPLEPNIIPVIGTSIKYAREDHAHPAQTTITGNAGTATKLQQPVNIALTGAVEGETYFDGSEDISINTNFENIDASKITSGILDENRLPNIPLEKLPAGALERLVIVTDQSARYKLTTADVQEGDTVKQEDTGVMYFVVDTSNLSNDNGYKVYTAGTATSVPWSGVTDKPEFLQLGETETTAYAGDKGKKINDIVTSLGSTILSEITSIEPSTDTVNIDLNTKTKDIDSGLFSSSSRTMVISAATQERAGVMSNTDKKNLDINSELFFILPEGTQFPYTLTEEDKSKLTKAMFIIATSNSSKKVAYAKTINVANGYQGYWINTENAGNTAVLDLSETVISAPALVNFGLVTYIEQTLNDKQKTQARTNIDAEKATIVENVEGAEVTLDVKGGRKYMCGELTSLTINSIEKSTDTTVIYFTSGATPTQFVYPEGTPIMGWDQPEANKTYLICVFNGNLSIEPYE